MKLHHAGEKGRAVCEADGLVSVTYGYRDVPFSDGSGVAKQILVGVCDVCSEVVAIPPQSTPAIKAAREKATAPIEAVLPAPYVDVLDLAAYRIDPEATVEFRKRLVLFYVHRLMSDKRAAERIARLMETADPKFRDTHQCDVVCRRLSLKVSPAVARNIATLAETAKLTKTDLIKSIVLQIDADIIAPKKPAHLAELQTLAAVAGC